jgi:hypothetical protein
MALRCLARGGVSFRRRLRPSATRLLRGGSTCDLLLARWFRSLAESVLTAAAARRIFAETQSKPRSAPSRRHLHRRRHRAAAHGPGEGAAGGLPHAARPGAVPGDPAGAHGARARARAARGVGRALAPGLRRGRGGAGRKPRLDGVAEGAACMKRSTRLHPPSTPPPSPPFQPPPFHQPPFHQPPFQPPRASRSTS